LTLNGCFLIETKKKFKKITGIHVYSVTSVDSTDFSMLYAACNDIPKLSLEDRVKCGILKNTNVTIQEFTSARLIDNKAKPVSNSKAPITAPSKIASPTTAIANKATSTSTATKRKGTLSFGPATTKKQAVATPTNNEPKPKAVQTKPSIATKTQTKNTKADHGNITLWHKNQLKNIH
jgi:hypothetical protein